MRENRNNQYRPEQLELYKQLRVTRPNSKIIMEAPIQYVTEKGHMSCIGDIVDFTRKEIFRLNGRIHLSSKVQQGKDDDQSFYLEQAGWKVTDINMMF